MKPIKVMSPSRQNYFFKKFIHLFIFSYIGSLLLCEGFLQLQRAGATLHCSAWASHCGLSLLQSMGSRRVNFSSCGTQAQQLWLTGLVAPWHMGSSRTRARTHVPCIGRRFLTTAPPGKSPKTTIENKLPLKVNMTHFSEFSMPTPLCDDNSPTIFLYSNFYSNTFIYIAL